MCFYCFSYTIHTPKSNTVSNMAIQLAQQSKDFIQNNNTAVEKLGQSLWLCGGQFYEQSST